MDFNDIITRAVLTFGQSLLGFVAVNVFFAAQISTGTALAVAVVAAAASVVTSVVRQRKKSK